MPNATHTPGPWHQKDVQPDAWTRQVWTDEGHGSVMIATTGGIDKDANARLIAAAPDLLAALLAVDATIGYTFDDVWTLAGWKDALAAARAAIARATQD